MEKEELKLGMSDRHFSFVFVPLGLSPGIYWSRAEIGLYSLPQLQGGSRNESSVAECQ